MRFTKNNIIRSLGNLPGWRTSRRIVVFESDDWGAIRMPSLDCFNILQSKGVPLLKGGSRRYNLYDNLATGLDLSSLFEVLSSFRDINHNPAVFTAMSVVANPSFEKIRASNFESYFYEPFIETLKKTSGCENSFELWKEGIGLGLFIPQFHGREHLNVATWMRALQQNDKLTMESFKQGFWGFANQHPLGVSYQAAFQLEDLKDLALQEEVIRSGLKLFEKIIGYKAIYFVPPNGQINCKLDRVSAEEGIRFMYRDKLFFESIGNGKYKRHFHWLGEQNKFGQRYIMRNCIFEPSEGGKDWVDSCLNDIDIAFKWHKPAVISSHRVNYIGKLNVENRTNSLKQLSNLLKAIVQKWPDVEFLSSEILGNILNSGNKVK